MRDLWASLAKERRGFVAVVAAYVVAVVALTSLSGHLAHIGDASMFFNPATDSQGYKLLADYYTSLGGSERPPEFLLEIRPFLFPLFLGLYRLIGIAGMQLLHLAMNAASLGLLYVSIKKFTGRPRLAALCTTLLAVTPSFTLIAFHALSEPLSLFLICVFITITINHFQEQCRESLYLAGFVVSLLVCVRPIALPFWVVMMIYIGIIWLRDHRRAVGELLLPLSPIVCQVVISMLVIAPGTAASAGGTVFSSWYFPVVYGQKEYGRFVGRKSPEAQEALASYPSMTEKLRYVLENYRVSIRTYLILLLGDSLMAGSNYVSIGIPEGDRNAPLLHYLRTWSVLLNRLVTVTHAAMLATMILWLFLVKRAPHSQAGITFYLFAVLLIAPAGLTYWQGDRHVLITAPLWLAAYGGLASRLIEYRRGSIVAAYQRT